MKYEDSKNIKDNCDKKLFKEKVLDLKKKAIKLGKLGVLLCDLDNSIITLLLSKAIMMKLLIKPSSWPIFQVKPGKCYHQSKKMVYTAQEDSSRWRRANTWVKPASLTSDQEQQMNPTIKAMMTLQLQSKIEKKRGWPLYLQVLWREVYARKKIWKLAS